jgi:AraC-like DNA-binding protein
LEVSGTHMTASLFDTVVYPAGWEHQEAASAERLREVICLWVDLPELKLEAPIQLHDGDNQMQSLFQMLYREYKRPQSEPYLLEYGLKYLLTAVLRDQREALSGGGDFIDHVLQYINLHCTEHMTLDQLAELEYVSKSYLSRQFKKHTGMTIVAYINTLRIDFAKSLLVSTNANINEVAYQAGFESPKYFYRTFRALTGETPAAFRRQYRPDIVP